MSDIEDKKKYLYAIIRKPQEGKTFICLENIKRNPNTIHLIITMNTIKSNRQFFSRAKDRFETSICVFNSKPKKEETIEGFYHAKDEGGVVKHLRRGVEYVIMCAHHKRFQDSIQGLLDGIEDSRGINKNVVIHIDEAHAYVPIYRENIVVMNNFDIVYRIFMYSATPFKIFERGHELFESIFICDCDNQFGVKKTEHYFGVKDCEHILGEDEEYELIDPYIGDKMVHEWGTEKQNEQHIVRGGLKWYSPLNEERWARPCFDLGDELEMLSYTKHVLKKMWARGIIKEDEYSYNFVPAYVRKFTHYAIKDMVLEIFPKAVIIVINGNGSNYFYKDGYHLGNPMCSSDETSDQINQVKLAFPDRPLFVTGFHCVGMSVTFINKETGNFDNVIFSHHHFPSDVQYQLCRFVFNHNSWSEEDRKGIKKTRLFIGKGCSEILKNCLEYESQVDEIDANMSGSLRGKDEIIGNVPVKEKKLPIEKKYDQIEKYTSVSLKKFTVDDEEDSVRQLDKLRECYREWTGKDLKGVSMPEKNEEGFYLCSAPDKRLHEGVLKMKKMLEGWKSTSNFGITAGKFKYARVYVAYDDKDENTSYTWFIRKMELEDRQEVHQFFESLDK